HKLDIGAASRSLHRLVRRFALVKLKADARRRNEMKLAPPPRLGFEWTDLGRERAILAVKCLKVGDANAEASILGPRLVIVLDEADGDVVALDASHAVALPDNRE